MTAVDGYVVLDQQRTGEFLFLGLMPRDPGGSLPPGTLHYTIDWGDDSPAVTFEAGTPAPSHNYTDSTTNTITVSSDAVTDSATIVWQDNVVHAIEGTDATLDTQPPRIADDGNPLSVTLNLELSNLGWWPSQVTFYVNWGDGSAVESHTVTTNSPETVAGPITHVYANTDFPWCDIKIGCDKYPYSVGVLRQGSSAGTIQTSVTPDTGYASLDVVLAVQNVFVTRTAPWLAPKLGAEKLAAAVNSQYNPNDSRLWLINWGDGICELVSEGSGPDAPFSIGHTYSTPGVYPIRVTSTEVGAVGTATVTALQMTVPARAAPRSASVRFS